MPTWTPLVTLGSEGYTDFLPETNTPSCQADSCWLSSFWCTSHTSGKHSTKRLCAVEIAFPAGCFQEALWAQEHLSSLWSPRSLIKVKYLLCPADEWEIIFLNGSDASGGISRLHRWEYTVTYGLQLSPEAPGHPWLFLSRRTDIAGKCRLDGNRN